MKKLVLVLGLLCLLAADQAKATPAVALFPRLAPGVGGVPSVLIPGLAVSIIGLAIISGITHAPPPKNPGYHGNPFLPGPHCKITRAQPKCA